MGTEKPSLWLTVEDSGYAIYGPGDKVSGMAHLVVVKSLLAKFVTVSLLAGSRVTATGKKKVKQSFFHKQAKVPFHNKREDTNRQLPVGHHKWAFEFQMPLDNNLPPSFSYRDPQGIAEISYFLVMCVYKTGSTGPTKDNMCTLPIKYSPKRSPSIVIDASLSQLCQSLLVRCRNDTRCPKSLIVRLKQHIPWTIQRIVGNQKTERGQLHVTLWLPRYAAFADHMDVSLKVQTEVDDPLSVVQVRLTRVEYRLWALTRIANGQVSRTQRHQIHSHVCTCSSLLENNGHWTSLRRHAPFRVQSRVHGVPLGKDAFSSLSPSFGSQNIVREYSLDVNLYLSICERIYRVCFVDNELVLLPHYMQLENN